LILIPGGKVWFIEFKLPGERPTVVQESTHALLRELGFRVSVHVTLSGVITEFNDAYKT
jgi:hypothetical protein